MPEYVKLTLIIELTEEWPRPDKTNWKLLTDHNGEIDTIGDEEFILAKDIEEARWHYA